MRPSILCAMVTLMLAAAASAVPAEGDRMLLDIGICWGQQTPEDGSASDGNYWKNSGSRGAVIDLVRASDGVATGAQFTMSYFANHTPPNTGQVSGNTPVSNLYPETAQTSLRWYNESEQPGYLYLTGMGDLPCDIGIYGYLSDGVGGDEDPDTPLTPASSIYTLTAGTCPGVTSIEVNVVDNTTIIAWFNSVTPDAGGNITFSVVGGTQSGDFLAAPVNVMDITVVPEPATMLLLLAGGTICALRRRRR